MPERYICTNGLRNLLADDTGKTNYAGFKNVLLVIVKSNLFCSIKFLSGGPTGAGLLHYTGLLQQLYHHHSK
jgi:hypothetical protein